MNLENINSEREPSGYCAGPLGCKGRTCDPNMKDCQGCISDYKQAVNHIPSQEEIAEMEWYMHNFVKPGAYEKK